MARKSMQFVSRTIAVAAVLFFLTSPSTLYASFTSAASGSTATMSGDTSGDTLTISDVGGLYRHNRFTAGDAGFNSDFDFDSTAAGDQTISSNFGTLNINAGGGNDTVTFG